MEQNRRNYYRLLRIQPDASFEVIQSSYRTLLQKLRMHPDLGGDEWNAGLLNQAYNTLRNPEKRAEYDKQLLQQYSIKELSEGHIKQNNSAGSVDSSNKQNNHSSNQRNYYRVLHVQTDSPEAVIKASFSTLINNENDPEQRQLLKEAFNVLCHKKEEYDRLLEEHGHSKAVFLLKNPDVEKKLVHETKEMKQKLSIYYNEESTVTQTPTAKSNSAYQPIITQYCSFCKTPHNLGYMDGHNPYCPVCDSPLTPPGENFLNQARRDIGRFKVNDSAFVYYAWPGKQEKVTIMDLSPTGICISSDTSFEENSIIKIDGQNFKAIGKISYSKKQGDEFNTGVQFLTIQFEKQKGHFLSAHT